MKPLSMMILMSVLISFTTSCTTPMYDSGKIYEPPKSKKTGKWYD
jgi:hypothetical protein